MELEKEIRMRDIGTEFNKVMNRLGKVFASEPGFQTRQKYVKGLLGSGERKNGWQLSESLGKTTPYEIQQFLYRERFNADGLRDVLREYVGEELGEKDGVLVVDETGFLKKGKNRAV